MSISSIFRVATRWALFPVAVVLALNIESRATEAGFDRISVSDLSKAIGASQLYQDLTTDTALYVALILAGAGAFAWLSYLIETLDKNSDRWAINSLSIECENLARALEGPLAFGLGSNARINKRLTRFAFDPIPERIDRKDKVLRERTARYLRAIGPAMAHDLEFAQALGLAAQDLNRAKAISRPK